MKNILLFALLTCYLPPTGAQVIFPRPTHITNPALQIPSTKLAQLNISLVNTFQAYQKGGGANNWGVKINPPIAQFPSRAWSITSYDYLAGCLGTVTYSSQTRQINNKTIIDAINAALGSAGLCEPDARGILATPGSPYAGRFNTNARIVVDNYDNLDQYAPYPSTEDNYYSELSPRPTVWNAPFVLNNDPRNGDPIETDGQPLILNWPNHNHISWNKPDVTAPAFSWIGSRIFILDQKNKNPLLRCFDISSFFEFSESFSKFCWDTQDRITDGKIIRDAKAAIDAPCAGQGSTLCGVSGSGRTLFYWSLKFNNVAECSALSPNYALLRYYRTYLGLDPAWGNTFGTSLDDANIAASLNTLAFAIHGAGSYSWSYKVLSDGLKWPVGSMTMKGRGAGYSPLCGTFEGQITMTEIDKTAKQIGGVFCLDF